VPRRNIAWVGSNLEAMTNDAGKTGGREQAVDIEEVCTVCTLPATAAHEQSAASIALTEAPGTTKYFIGETK
jgi:hypothetical protein